MMRFKIWRTGTGATAASRFLEIKSQKTLGQIKPSIALATWSVCILSVLVSSWEFWVSNVQADAVRIINRPQWFLMSLPIVLSYRYSVMWELCCVLELRPANISEEIKSLGYEWRSAELILGDKCRNPQIAATDFVRESLHRIIPHDIEILTELDNPEHMEAGYYCKGLSWWMISYGEEKAVYFGRDACRRDQV
jgi:hypothetical protein